MCSPPRFAPCGGSPNTPGGPIVNSGGGGSGPPPTKLVSVKVKVDVPSGKGGIRPGYVSPNTQSLVIQLASVDGGGVTGVNATTIETFTGAHDCAQSGGETICNGTTDGSPGEDVFSVTTYAGRDATGSVLSVGTVKAKIGGNGTVQISNSLSLSLDGVIASLKLSLDPTAESAATKLIPPSHSTPTMRAARRSSVPVRTRFRWS